MTENKITREAAMTAHDYMARALHDIDELLGEGTARKHPELIAAYMQAAAIDGAALTIGRQISDSLDAIADAIGRTGLQSHLDNIARGLAMVRDDDAEMAG
jgi:hypothetical protein